MSPWSVVRGPWSKTGTTLSLATDHGLRTKDYYRIHRIRVKSGTWHPPHARLGKCTRNAEPTSCGPDTESGGQTRLSSELALLSPRTKYCSTPKRTGSPPTPVRPRPV